MQVHEIKLYFTIKKASQYWHVFNKFTFESMGFSLISNYSTGGRLSSDINSGPSVVCYNLELFVGGWEELKQYLRLERQFLLLKFVLQFFKTARGPVNISN